MRKKNELFIEGENCASIYSAVDEFIADHLGSSEVVRELQPLRDRNDTRSSFERNQNRFIFRAIR
jgi:hypothetical protein